MRHRSGNRGTALGFGFGLAFAVGLLGSLVGVAGAQQETPNQPRGLPPANLPRMLPPDLPPLSDPRVPYSDRVILLLASSPDPKDIGLPNFKCMAGATIGFAFPGPGDAICVYDAIKNNVKVVTPPGSFEPGSTPNSDVMRPAPNPNAPAGGAGGVRLLPGLGPYAFEGTSGPDGSIYVAVEAREEVAANGTTLAVDVYRCPPGGTEWTLVRRAGPRSMPANAASAVAAALRLTTAVDGAIVLHDVECGQVIVDNTGATVPEPDKALCGRASLGLDPVGILGRDALGRTYRAATGDVEERALEQLDARTGVVIKRMEWAADEGACAFYGQRTFLMRDGSLLRVGFLSGKFRIARIWL